MLVRRAEMPADARGPLKAARAGKAFLSTYLVDRTTCIYVVLPPAPVPTALLDAAGLVFLATLVAATGASWTFSRATEARTERVRRVARGLLERRPHSRVTGAPAKG